MQLVTKKLSAFETRIKARSVKPMWVLVVRVWYNMCVARYMVYYVI